MRGFRLWVVRNRGGIFKATAGTHKRKGALSQPTLSQSSNLKTLSGGDASGATALHAGPQHQLDEQP